MGIKLLYRVAVATVSMVVGSLVLSASQVMAQDINKPSNPPIVTVFNPTKSVHPADELVLQGTNDSNQNAVLVIRLDDTQSSGYATRVNEERTLPPGNFTLRLALASLRTPQGTALNLDSLRELHLFTLDGNPSVMLSSMDFNRGFSLPQGAFGWDFGPKNSATFPGFEAVAAGDMRLSGKNLLERKRPGGDALIGDGIQGVEQFIVPLSNGRWHVTLWTEDLGEWENLPHPLAREIDINGMTVLRENLTAADWIKNRYLRGRNPEAVIDGDPWMVIGAARGGRIEADIPVTSGRLTLTMRGDSPAAQYLAGILVEPAAETLGALLAVEAQRRARFLETWRTQPIPHAPKRDGISLTPNGDLISETSKIDLFGAPGTWLTLDLWLHSSRSSNDTQIALALPKPLKHELRTGHWSYQRPQAQSTLLVTDDNYLYAYQGKITLSPLLPRRINTRIFIPEQTTGDHSATLVISQGKNRLQVPFTIHALAVNLPRATKPIGVYLENAPYYDWFPELMKQRNDAARCDLQFLANHGITGLSPPFSTPDKNGIRPFIADLKRLKETGYELPVLAYAPIKRLAEQMQGAALANYVQRVVATINAFHLTQPIWSIADEPSNPSQVGGDMQQLSELLHTNNPGSRFAGHLNHREDVRYLRLFDVVLVNQGFGADIGDINNIKKHNVEPWLYNLSRPRLAAGFYLWRVNADGYLQWHARMPTADPFDPTDGREADIQFLLPHAETCPSVPDIDATLLDIADGITDFRWLKWLELESRHNKVAQSILDRLQSEAPDNWSAAEALDMNAASRWRSLITDFARSENFVAPQADKH